MSLLIDAIFSSVAFSHLIVDILNGVRAVLLAYLSGPLGLTNTDIGLISTVYVLSAALIQPLFGYLTDRLGTRWAVTGGVLWMGIFYTLAMSIPGKIALPFLVLASMGSGAYHPAGTMIATLLGRNHFHGRETTANSYFVLFGQLGYFFGPVLGGPLLDRFGPMGLFAFTLPALPAGLYAARQLKGFLAPMPGGGSQAGAGISPAGHSTAGQNAGRFARPRLGRAGLLALLAFALVAAFQSWAQQNMITFVPKHLSDLGQPASLYGLITALFTLGTAAGNLAGGSLADRLGKKRVAFITLLLAGVPLYLLPAAGASGWVALLILLAGTLIGATQSIIIVSAQRMLPVGIGLASGLTLGFIFSSGAIGTYFSGLLADAAGLPLVFQTSALLVVSAAGLVLLIKEL